MRAQPVEDADRGLGVGHPDVDVQGAVGVRADEARASVAIAVVARLVDVLDVAERAVGMDPGADRRAARRAQRRRAAR